MEWNKSSASTYARSHAHARSTHRCAEYTRKAIRAGGIDTGITLHAKDYGKLLVKAGFRAIGHHESPQDGDVVIIQPYRGGNPGGHMAIFDGQDWYSDFRQRDMWAGSGYRITKPPYTIYRRD